jgi:hypothetical protein
MSITNNSDKTLEPPWKPVMWTFANWHNPEEVRYDSKVWEWGQRGKEFNEPPIAPGGTGYWTYMAFPIARWEYVKAAAFYSGDQEYNFEFPRPRYAGEYNFKDCGPYPGETKPSNVDPALIDNPTP